MEFINNFVPLVENGSSLVRIRYEILSEGSLFIAIAKELLRQIIRENDLKSIGDVYTLLKDRFKELLQELLEADMDATLGYNRQGRSRVRQ